MIYFKISLHLFIVLLLTIITQTGGLVYLISLICVRKVSSEKRLKLVSFFSILYLMTTFLIVPNIAPFFGREKIKESNTLIAHSFFYKLANRNYVKAELNSALINISNKLLNEHKGIKLIYLDANFPFIDNFPLLPHLSHNDGKKIDVSLIYEKNKKLTNKKPSVSGYGAYEEPRSKEHNQPEICENKGYWQYDFPKYLTMGKINKNIVFSNRATRDLIKIIIEEKQIGKIFIEPHLKTRLKLSSSKIRFHGCRAVRHDDHIHFQLK